ncbi:MAG: energy-coupled thiamine transporter ThiT [Clostridia bacterium]|nr:energy-coupled thiamine transporter ThiT [Clostridia bacterium]
MILTLNIILYCLLGVSFGLVILFSLQKKNLKTLLIILGSIFTAYFIVRFCLVPLKIKNYDSLSEFGIYFCTILLTAFLVVLPIIFDKEKFLFTTKSIAYGGICVSLAFALSFIKIEFLGGSITLASALPIIIFSYKFGAKKGVFLGVIFGVLQFIQKPTVYHFAQALIDYPIAFGFIGLSGLTNSLTKKPVINFIIGASVGLIGRYIAHIISGYFVFYIYNETNMSSLVYSIVFNMNVLIDLAIVILVGTILYTQKSFLKAVEKDNR